MSESSHPRNRRERRAAAREASKSGQQQPSSAADIPMVKPDYAARPAGKTLYQLAEERQALLAKGNPFPKATDELLDPSRKTASVVHRDGDFEFMFNEPFGAFANAVIYCFSLSMLHVTLDVLVLSQYRQDVVWREIAARIARMTPALFCVLWIFHTEQVKRWKNTRQVFFLGLSIAAGCYLVYVGNEYGYYHVMKRAPPVGTLWVWSVVEMELWFAIMHVLVMFGYIWWGGYSAF